MKDGIKQKAHQGSSIAWLICILGAIFYAYEYLLRIEPSVMVNQIMQSFAIKAGDFGLLASFYYFAYAPMQLIVGTITDRFGPRRVLSAALIACIMGSFLFELTHVFSIAAVGRLLIGAGSAFAFVGVMKLGAVWLPPKRFALFAGLATALGMVGAMVGDIELSALVKMVGWHAAINYGTVAGIILLPFIWFIVRDQPKDLMSGSALENDDYTFKKIFQALWDMLRKPQLWIAGFIGCMLYLSLSVFGELWGFDYLYQVYGLTQQKASLINSLVFLGWLVGAPFFGWFSDFLESRKNPLIIGTVLSFIMICIILYVPNLSIHLVMILIFLFGFFCSSEILVFAVAKDRTKLKYSATAISFINMVIMLSGVIFQPIVGKLMDLLWDGKMLHGIPAYSAFDFKIALMIMPIGLFLSIIAATLIQKSYHLQVSS